MARTRGAFANRRKAVGLSQQALADRLEVDVTSVRHWEAGRHPPLPRFRPDLARHLQVSLDELDRLLKADTTDEPETPSDGVAVPDDNFELLRSKLATKFYEHAFDPADIAPDPLTLLTLRDGTPLAATAGPAEHELDALLLSPLAQWASLDNRVGPHRLRQSVSSHFGIIEAFLDDARGPDARRLAYITARHAEFGGWLAQDAGALVDAMRWTDAALEAARLIDDRELESYVLMRKSNIALDQGQSDLAVALADAAWHSARPLGGALKALALRQRAQALTASRDASAALNAVDLARAQLTGPDANPSDLTSYCTLGYIDMESAACLVDLGQAGDAIPILEHGLQSWSPEFRRDLGLCLSRLALAYAHNREPEPAAAIAAQSAQIARATGSRRTVRVLGQVTSALESLGRHDQARALREAFAQP